MNRDEILRTNRRVYDAMAAAQDPLCRPAKDQDVRDPLNSIDPSAQLDTSGDGLGTSIAGKNLLCLAGGGGRQSSLYAAAGANVTVVDLSPAMLELDREVARTRGHSIRLFEGSMDDLCMLSESEFDIVIHPVSTCYLPDVQTVFNEVARVTRPGGIYISQHKQPTSLQLSTTVGAEGKYTLQHEYYLSQPVPQPQDDAIATDRLRERGAMEFLHTWEALLGGMCRAGFVIADVSEPRHAKADAVNDTFAHRSNYCPPYVRVHAVRKSTGKGLLLNL